MGVILWHEIIEILSVGITFAVLVKILLFSISFPRCAKNKDEVMQIGGTHK